MGLIIGLCGYPGAGKTEVRKILVRDYGFEDISSKSVIYELASVATGVPENKFSDPMYKDGEFEKVPLRKIAAHLGYAIEDLFGEDYLIRKALLNHRVADRPNKNFVIDSLRMNQPKLLENDLEIVEVRNKRIERPTNVYDHFDLGEVMFSVVHNNGGYDNLGYNIKNTLALLGYKA